MTAPAPEPCPFTLIAGAIRYLDAQRREQPMQAGAPD